MDGLKLQHAGDDPSAFAADAISAFSSYIATQPPSTAPNLTYEQYYQYSYALQKAEIDVSQVMWSMVTPSTFSVSSNTDGSWSAHGNVSLITNAACSATDVNYVSNAPGASTRAIA